MGKDKVQSMCKSLGEGGSTVYMKGWKKNGVAREQRARRALRETQGRDRQGPHHPGLCEFVKQSEA